MNLSIEKRFTLISNPFFNNNYNTVWPKAKPYYNIEIYKTNYMNFHTRKWIKPQDLNPNETLFGGRLLEWIDEEAALYSIIQLENPRTVTKFISEINFRSSAKKGDIIEIGLDVLEFGATSVSLCCEVRNKMTREVIISIEKIIMVGLDENGKPSRHGKTKIEYVKDRLSK